MAKYQNYWNARSGGVEYNGEEFYTVTPLPLYLHRRERIKDFILENISTDTVGLHILDYGCGDGYYSLFTYSSFPNSKIVGTDLSSAMIDSAKKNADSMNINFCLVDELDDTEAKFDYILIFLVLAHIVDREELIQTLRRLHRLLKPDGKMLVVEATNNRNQTYEYAVRRTRKTYKQIFIDSGFSIEKQIFHSYPLFNLFENCYRMFFLSNLKLKSFHNKNITTKNLNIYPQYLKKVFSLFNQFKNIDEKIQNFPWKGNTFFVLQKSDIE